jgi:hypothetical protein
LLIAFLLVASARGQTQSTTQPLDAETEKMRSTCICKLIVLRQAIAEADVEDSVRESVIKVIDDNEKNLDRRIRAAYDAFQSDGDRTKARIVINSIPTAGVRVAAGDKAAAIRIGQQNMILESELQLLKDGKALDQAKKLELSESQQQQIRDLLDDSSKKLSEGGPDEKYVDWLGAERVHLLLQTRKQFRTLLTDDQRAAWDDTLREPVIKTYGQILTDMNRRRERPPSHGPQRNN